MEVAVKPKNCGDNPADYSQQENPPEDAGDGFAVPGEPSKPVAASVMQENVIAREYREQDSEYYMHPHRPGVYAGGSLQLDAGYQHKQ